MNSAQSKTEFVNPFSASRHRAGALPFRFASSSAEVETESRFAASGFWGQIVGPHGSGKSTLAHHLAQRFGRTFRQTVCVTIRCQRNRLGWPRRLLQREWLQVEHYSIADRNEPNAACRLWIVDGLERLSPLHQRGMLSGLRAQQAAALFTTHSKSYLAKSSFALPVIAELAPDWENCWHVVQTLQADVADPLRRQQVRQCFEENQGNVRATLFALYDLYETHSQRR